jgi:hypothetical protein
MGILNSRLAGILLGIPEEQLVDDPSGTFALSGCDVGCDGAGAVAEKVDSIGARNDALGDQHIQEGNQNDAAGGSEFTGMFKSV